MDGKSCKKYPLEYLNKDIGTHKMSARIKQIIAEEQKRIQGKMYHQKSY